MRNVPTGLHSIRGLMGCCHLLEDGDASVMIDTGMVVEPFCFRRLVRKLGLKADSIKASSSRTVTLITPEISRG